jgi:integrase
MARCEHVIRMILIGIYTGRRPGAILRLRWLPSTEGGWFDLETATLHRRAKGKAESNKRQPLCRIHKRLLPWLRRWRQADLAAGMTHVVHYQGRPVAKLRSSWKAVARAAGHDVEKEGPHVLRHTCATWLMQGGVNPYEAAGYLGMSTETLLEIYGHHHKDFQHRAASADGRRP